MTSAAVFTIRNRRQYHALGFIGLAALLLCLPWLTSCTAANSAGTNVNPQLSGNLSPAKVGVPYNGTISVSGGKAPYVFNVSSGSLPSGLALSRPPEQFPAPRGRPGFLISLCKPWTRPA